jgi:hypothetical protein
MNFSNFSIASTSKRPQKTNVPELHVTPTKNKLKINEAMSRLLNVVHGEYLMVINNFAQVDEAAAEQHLTGAERDAFIEENVAFLLAKGIPMTRNGKAVIGPKILTKEERADLENGTYEGEVDEDGKPIEPKFYGSKLASNTKSTERGQILECSDANNYPMFKGSPDDIKVWVASTTPITVPLTIDKEDVTIEAYEVKFDRVEDKLVRGTSAEEAEE